MKTGTPKLCSLPTPAELPGEICLPGATDKLLLDRFLKGIGTKRQNAEIWRPLVLDFLFMKFVHLHTHSHFSLLDGLSKIDELVLKAKEMGMEALALTDHGVMYGAIEFYKKAKKEGIKPIIGCEVYISENSMYQKRSGIDDKRYHLVLLAKNEAGYRNLVKLVSVAHLDGFYYKPRMDKELLRKHSEGLIALSACLGGEISKALLSGNKDKAKTLALEYQDIFGKGNYFIELQEHPNLEDQNIVTPKLLELANELNIPIVATQDSHYTHSDDAYAHDVLLAVQTGNKLDDSDRLTMRSDDFSLMSQADMYEKFRRKIGDEMATKAIENTSKIAEKCNLDIKLGEIQLPHFPIPVEFKNDFDYLEHLVNFGIENRYGKNANENVRKRIDYELGVIKQTGFTSYFLIVHDFVNWAKNKGIVVGPGRGSAAGSIVAYLLNITNVDPLKYDLLFERFLNPERISMPDIDLDFDDARRDEVLKYVSEKYGQDHVAQVITFGTMAARGGIRDAGRALGYSYDFCDKIAKMIPLGANQGKTGFLTKAVQTVEELKNMYEQNPEAKKLIDSAKRLEGVARHSSTHACAVVITPKPLTEYLPLQQGTKEGDIITQYEMHAVEDLGLLKMDFLGLANLTIIENTLRLIETIYGKKIDIDKISLDDAKTFRLFQEANTTGVFQLESSGMKRYLKELKPTRFEDIALMIALYRPGPMDLIPDFIGRKQGRSKVVYLHPKLEPVLKNTYGIMVYQEQLMAAAQALAGFSLSQADILRKAVGKKITALLQAQKNKLIDGCIANGVRKDVAEKFWELIEPFDRYGFNKSHAISYGMIAYQTAYLKAHYPVEFMAAFMNSETGDVERIAFLIEECKQMGISVLPPDINESFTQFAVVKSDGKPAIRFGLTAIKNVGQNVVVAMIEERKLTGKFESVENFVSRIHNKDLNKKSLESLIKCGALDKFGERNVLLNNLEQLLNYSREKQKNASVGQISLFGESTSSALPPLRLATSQPATSWQKLMWEKELLGLFVSDHPLNGYKNQLKVQKVTPIKNLTVKAFGPQKIAGMVTSIHKIVTKTGKPMIFSMIEDLTSKIEVVVFPNMLEKYPETWKENNILVVEGKINDRDGTVKLICDDVRIIASLA